MIDRIKASLFCALAAASLLTGCERDHQVVQTSEVVGAANTLVDDYNAGDAAARPRRTRRIMSVSSTARRTCRPGGGPRRNEGGDGRREAPLANREVEGDSREG